MVCRIWPLAGSMRTSVWFLPAVASSLPSGLRASAWGRIPGNVTWRPIGVNRWPVGGWYRFGATRPTLCGGDSGMPAGGVTLCTQPTTRIPSATPKAPRLSTDHCIGAV